jgi:hypothetical protein
MVSFMPRPFYLWGKNTRYPQDRRVSRLTAGLDRKRHRIFSNLIRILFAVSEG